jgi:prepilin-type N-terminal cleavage/methylation domain-containing protein
MKFIRRSTAGYSFIELIVATFIISILASAALPLASHEASERDGHPSLSARDGPPSTSSKTRRRNQIAAQDRLRRR